MIVLNHVINKKGSLNKLLLVTFVRITFIITTIILVSFFFLVDIILLILFFHFYLLKIIMAYRLPNNTIYI